jgi:hypothetical protein
MSLFKPAENTMAFFKAGYMGEAGSGKTHTATIVMIGLIKHLQAKGIAGADKPVFMLDTEQGSAWVKPLFDAAGIPLHVAKTRAFKDLTAAVREAEKNASGLFIDSITHFWEDLQNSYMANRQRTRLEFQDWAVLKKMWREFSDTYVNSQLHCILCGRLGFEYEQYQDDRGKRQIEKSGVKMRAEKDLGYEPNILVWMERDMDLSTKIVSRTARVLKDRSQKLDGKEFPNPTFATFLPHIDFLALGGTHEAVDTTRNSEDVIPDEDGPSSDMRTIRRGIVLDEIEALLVKHYPSTSAADKKAKADLIETYFKTTSWTEISKLMPLLDLQSNYDGLYRSLNGGTASRYGVKDAEPAPVVDEIPFLNPAPPATVVDLPAKTIEPEATVANEPSDIVLDLTASLQEATNTAWVNRVWKKFAKTYDTADELTKAVMDAEKGKALARVTLQAAE